MVGDAEVRYNCGHRVCQICDQALSDQAGPQNTLKSCPFCKDIIRSRLRLKGLGIGAGGCNSVAPE
jgi:hypothetical protein